MSLPGLRTINEDFFNKLTPPLQTGANIILSLRSCMFELFCYVRETRLYAT